MKERGAVKVIDFFTNSVLGLLLVGIMALATLSVVSLSPQEYEPNKPSTEVTEQPKQNVLGAQDQILNEDILTSYQDAYVEQPEIQIQTFEGSNGYLAKAVSQHPYNTGTISTQLVTITNNSNTPSQYIAGVNIPLEMTEGINFYFTIDGQRILVNDFVGEGKFTPLNMSPNSAAQIGFEIESNGVFVSDGILEFEIQVINI